MPSAVSKKMSAKDLTDRLVELMTAAAEKHGGKRKEGFSIGRNPAVYRWSVHGEGRSLGSIELLNNNFLPGPLVYPADELGPTYDYVTSSAGRKIRQYAVTRVAANAGEAGAIDELVGILKDNQPIGSEIVTSPVMLKAIEAFYLATMTELLAAKRLCETGELEKAVAGALEQYLPRPG